jgi:hypothetical protein
MYFKWLCNKNYINLTLGWECYDRIRNGNEGLLSLTCSTQRSLPYNCDVMHNFYFPISSQLIRINLKRQLFRSVITCLSSPAIPRWVWWKGKALNPYSMGFVIGVLSESVITPTENSQCFPQALQTIHNVVAWKGQRAQWPKTKIWLEETLFRKLNLCWRIVCTVV